MTPPCVNVVGLLLTINQWEKNKVVCVSAGIILNKSRLSGQTLTYFVTEDKNNSTERVFSHEAEILRDNFLENDVSNAHEKVAKQKI